MWPWLGRAHSITSVMVPCSNNWMGERHSVLWILNGGKMDLGGVRKGREYNENTKYEFLKELTKYVFFKKF